MSPGTLAANGNQQFTCFSAEKSAVLILALLVCNTAAGLACRLAGGLALATAALLCTLT